MKKAFILLSVILLAFACVSVSFSEEITTEQNTMKTKLKRGVINIVTSPLELPKQIKHYYNEGKAKGQKNIVWVFVGTVKGVANTVGRMGSGLWDTVTFNVNLPKNYEPLMKPDFVNGK